MRYSRAGSKGSAEGQILGPFTEQGGLGEDVHIQPISQ